MLRVADHVSETDTGRQRRANEDAHFARAPLFVVADGMGGAQAGEVASATAIEVMGSGVGEGPGSPEERLVQRVAEANLRIFTLSSGDRDLAGMGTTVTAAYVGEHDVSIAHVGDSRAYLLRDGGFQRLTEDHTLVEEFVRSGKLTAAEAEEHPQRSIITRALGIEADVQVDRLTVRGRDGDVFLLCSDGLTSMVPEARVGEIAAAAAPDLEAAARALIAAANDAGGRDNITVVLFRLEDVAAAPAADETGQHTIAGGEGPSTAEVRAAVATAPAAPPAERAETSATRRLQPRAPRGDEPRRRRGGRARRWLGPAIVTAIIMLPVIGGAWIAGQAIYFLGVTDDGSVAVYKGLPYDLPAGIELYTPEYVTGLTPAQIPAGRRDLVTKHKLRSHDDARDLARQLELGQLTPR
jgi:protein phosphatase